MSSVEWVKTQRSNDGRANFDLSFPRETEDTRGHLRSLSLGGLVTPGSGPLLRSSAASLRASFHNVLLLDSRSIEEVEITSVCSPHLFLSMQKMASCVYLRL